MSRRLAMLIFITLAGETIFMLPFLIPRLYRPLMLEAWHLTNTDIGNAFFAYGITAMLSYIFGGPFADKYHPKILISSSLVLTATGSLFLVLFPSPSSLILTYEFFGVSTILLMWGALIKTTHIVGGEAKRSTAMGILDGGRGLTAAVVSSLLVILVSVSFSDLADPAQQRSAMTAIYLSTAAFTLLISIGVWFSFSDLQSAEISEKKWDLGKALESLKNPQVWLLSVVILSSYCGYKGVDNYSTYLVDVHQLDLSKASIFTSVIFWLRPVAALLTGILADRFHKKNNTGRFLVLLFLLLMGGATQLLLAFTGLAGFYYAFAVVLASASFAYALRAIYFSVFGDLKIGNHLVGTTVGIVSFVGFLPDIFFGLITGRLIDGYPGESGFKYSFLFTAACLFAGAAACLSLYRRMLKSRK